MKHTESGLAVKLLETSDDDGEEASFQNVDF
jgi:hypothetical protein